MVPNRRQPVVALNEYGTVLAVGAPEDGSAGKGVNNGKEQVEMYKPGAAYLFERAGGAWTRLAYVKASNTDELDEFGTSVALSSDGKTLAVGPQERHQTESAAIRRTTLSQAQGPRTSSPKSVHDTGRKRQVRGQGGAFWRRRDACGRCTR